MPPSDEVRGGAQARLGALTLCLVAALTLAGCGDAAPSPPSGPASGSGIVAPVNASGGAPTALGTTARASGSPAQASGASAGVGSSTAPAGSSIAATARVIATLMGAHLPRPLSRAVVATSGGSVLVIGGVSPAGTTAAILRLDPATGSVTRLGRLASAVHDASGAPLGQSWLVLGGGRTLASAVVQNVSLSGAGVSVSTTGALPSARADGAAAAVGGSVVVAGGGRGGVPDPTVLMTADGAHFTIAGRLPVAVRYPASAVADGVVYLFGGATTSGVSTVIQAIDPKTDAIRVVAHLPYALTQATAFSLGGRILIAGGMRAGRPSTAILAYDPATGRTTLVGRLPVPVADAGAAVVGDTAYLVGGETGSAFVDSIIAVH